MENKITEISHDLSTNHKRIEIPIMNSDIEIKYPRMLESDNMIIQKERVNSDKPDFIKMKGRTKFWGIENGSKINRSTFGVSVF